VPATGGFFVGFKLRGLSYQYKILFLLKLL